MPSSRDAGHQPSQEREGVGDPPAVIFVSYSHKNESEKEKLVQQFGVLEKWRNVRVRPWADSDISAGKTWRREIEDALAHCDAAVLLITDAFLGSEFIKTFEVPRILKRRQEEELPVVAIIARDCGWQLVPWLEKMQVRPQYGKPVWREDGRYVDFELAAIVVEIHVLAKQARENCENAKLEAIKRARAEQESAARYANAQNLIAEYRDKLIAKNDFLEAMTPPGKPMTQEQQMERWRILQIEQEKMFRAMDEVISKRHSAEKAMAEKWEKLIRSD